MFLMTSEDYSYLNSGTVREVAEHAGRIDAFVPPVVRRALRRKFRR